MPANVTQLLNPIETGDPMAAEELAKEKPANLLQAIAEQKSNFSEKPIFAVAKTDRLWFTSPLLN